MWNIAIGDKNDNWFRAQVSRISRQKQIIKFSIEQLYSI